MRPKKAKELIVPVADSIGLPSSLVSDVVNFYWEEVWSVLTDVPDIKVHVTNLGDFNIKHWLLDKEIENLSNTIYRFKEKPGPRKYAVHQDMTTRLNQLKNLKKVYLEEKQRKDFIHQHKKTNTNDKTMEFSGVVET
jgi:predicted RNase H-like nuclease (RuvC/YqgF family)